MALSVIFDTPIGRLAFRAWGLARLPSQFGKELLPAEPLPHPRCFCEACQNKGDAGASVYKRVKTEDLETSPSALQGLSFDTDAHYWCRGWRCWRAARRGRACAEYSQRIIRLYLLNVNRHCEVLGPKPARGEVEVGKRSEERTHPLPTPQRVGHPRLPCRSRLRRPPHFVLSGRQGFRRANERGGTPQASQSHARWR